MARKHPPYTPEFRRQMIELVRSGRSPESLSKEFEPTAQAIRNWFAQAERDAGRRRDEGVTTAERDEISRLRREVENDSSFNVASEFDHRGNTLAAISHRLHGEVSNRHGGFQALRQHGIGRVDERLDQLHLHN